MGRTGPRYTSRKQGRRERGILGLPFFSGSGGEQHAEARQIDLDGDSSQDLLLRECFRSRIRGRRTSAPLAAYGGRAKGKTAKPSTPHLRARPPCDATRTASR